MLFAILSLLPKKYGKSNHKHHHLLHFSEIDKLSETEYLKRMKESLKDTFQVAQMISSDIYHQFVITKIESLKN